MLVLVACSGDDEDGAAAFLPALVEDVAPVEDSSPINDLEASIEGPPAAAEPGDQLVFTVV